MEELITQKIKSIKNYCKKMSIYNSTTYRLISKKERKDRNIPNINDLKIIFKEQEINPKKFFLDIKFDKNKADLIENIIRYCEFKKINKISEYKRISKGTAKEFNIFTFRELNAR